MKQECYKTYRVSDIECLGEIPKHWNTRRLKDVSKIVDCKNRTPEYYEEGEYLVVRTSNVRNGKIKLDKLSFTNKPNFIEWTKRGVPPKGSILFTREAPAGEVCLVPEGYDSCLGQRMMNFISYETDYSAYLLYYLLSHKIRCYLEAITSGSTVHHLRVPQVFEIPVLVPPSIEQKAIAHYLDTKTAQIDRKIELLTQKVSLYGNLKRSLIHEVVTRGLDKSVPMKDSAIEWLGKVPGHWKERRIKDISILQSGNNITSEQISNEGKYPVYGGNGLRGYFSDFTNNGSHILIGRQGALCGNINYASGKFWATDHAVVVYPNRTVHTKWYSEILKAMNLNQYSISAAQPGLAVEKIKRLFLPFPPFEEQKAIADFLKKKTTQIDRLIYAANTQIEKLKELRKTLINDVVTGKIKVA